LEVDVPKLIVDASTLQMLQGKLSGFSIHGGPNGRLLEPGIIDVLDDDASRGRWLPGDNRTRLIVLGAEACREIVSCAQRFDEQLSRKRLMKNLSVPVCNLMRVVSSLHSSLKDKEWPAVRLSWPPDDRANYRATAKMINKTHLKGPVQRIRHKLGAHLDPDVFDNVPPFKWQDILGALGDALVLFILVLNHPAHAFSWIREMGSSEDGSRLIVETMVEYPACVRCITDVDGRVIDVAAITLAADPRLEIKEAFLEGVAVYNELIRGTGTRLPSIRKNETPLVVDVDAQARPWTKELRLLRLS
jgi:hypothetical protein